MLQLKQSDGEISELLPRLEAQVQRSVGDELLINAKHYRCKQNKSSKLSTLRETVMKTESSAITLWRTI